MSSPELTPGFGEGEGELLHRPNVLRQNALCRCTVRWNEAALYIDATTVLLGNRGVLEARTVPILETFESAPCKDPSFDEICRER